MRTAPQVLEAWREELSERLKRSAEEIVAKGLSAYDFSPSESVEIRFPDESHARFKFAFALISKERKMVAVFTEHCGYLEFPLLREMSVIQHSEDFYYHDP